MGLDVRVLEPDALDEALQLFFAAMLLPRVPDAELELHRIRYAEGRTLGAFVDGQLVGTAAAIPFPVVVPGGAVLATAGITRVGVRPTHTRRGVVSALMREQLTDVAARGEAFASLRASESGIYGRFGYGPATQFCEYELARAHGAFRAPIEASGSFRILERDELAEVLPDAYLRCAHRAGAVLRPPALWAARLRPFRGDGSPTRWVVAHVDDAGVVDGYADYEVPGRTSPMTVARVDVHDLWAVDGATAAALWRWLLDLDLAEWYALHQRPLDEPLRWLLADSRRLRTTSVTDESWIRVTDVAGALGGRSWPDADPVVVDVADALLPDQSGTWEVGPGGTRRVDAEPDLGCDVAVLGATCLGGTSWAELAAAGRVDERVPGALERADRLFGVRPLPWSGTFF